MSLLETLIGYKGDHPKDVAKAFAEMNKQLKMQTGAAEDQKWDARFQELRDQGMSPAQGFDPQTGAGTPTVSPLERWEAQINALITSGNPVLQKKGLDMVGAYQQRATAAEASQAADPTAVKLALARGFTPGTKAFNDYVDRVTFKKSNMYAPQTVSPAEAKNLQWIDPERTDPIVYQPVADIVNKVKTTDDADEMRSNAMAVIDGLEHALWNPETGIYNDPIWQGKGASGVIKAGVVSAVRDLTQKEGYKPYSDVRAGSAAQVVRAMGEKGALSDKDIERALALLPNISGYRGLVDLPDTGRMKMDMLRMMLQIAPSQWKPILDQAEKLGIIPKFKETDGGWEPIDPTPVDSDVPPGFEEE